MLRMNHVAGMLVLVGAIVAGCSSNHLPTPPQRKAELASKPTSIAGAGSIKESRA